MAVPEDMPEISSWRDRNLTTYYDEISYEENASYIKQGTIEYGSNDGTWQDSLDVLTISVEGAISSDWVALEAAIVIEINKAVPPVGQETEFAAYQADAAQNAALIVAKLRSSLDASIWWGWNQTAI